VALPTDAIFEVGGSLLAAASVFLLKRVRKFVWRRIRFLLGHKAHFTQRLVESDLTIYTLLHRLIDRLDADRAFIFQFHNGQTFSFRNPVWKMSCTHPAVRAGYSQNHHNMRDILASTALEIVVPLYGIYSAGASNHPCSACQECAKQHKGLAVFNVDEMPEVPAKGMLLTHGIKAMVFTPLMHDGEVGGFVGVDFCRLNVDEIQGKNLSELCKVSTQIAAELAQRKRL
jgi:hypothetical protein